MVLTETEVQDFNEVARKLQQAEFRTPKTPGEWQRMHRNPPRRDYDKLFGAVVPFVQAYVLASAAGKAQVATHLSNDALGILRTFAQSAAVVGVRLDSRPLIAYGLVALAILGEIDDPKDLLFYLSALHYSALKLGIDARELFAEVALVCSERFREWMRGFPLLPTSANGLSAFNLHETATAEGFDIVQNLSSGRGGADQ